MTEPSLPSSRTKPGDYERALHFWFGRINYEQRLAQPGDLKLDRMRALLKRLGDPHERLRIVHVAGSKGKGSTSALLAAILRSAGYRTGLFTSPHLTRVEERVQVDGEPISTEEMVAILNDVERAMAGAVVDGPLAPCTGGALDPTFFEVATALGFLHFLRRRVDIAVVEVGLGGRFDSTNVCLPEAALITSISFDHTRQLGNRLSSIAMEKAGIIKPGRPAISGATAPEALAVIEETCRTRGARLQQLGVDFHFDYEPGKISYSPADGHYLRRPRVRVRTRQRTWPAVDLALVGEHQAANAAVAVACVEQLRLAGWHISERVVVEGLAGAAWPARLEVFGARPLLVLDCAHNVASAEALVATLLASFPPARRLLIFASSNDKDVSGMLGVLAPHFAHFFLTRYGKNPRSVPAEELGRLLEDWGGAPYSCHDASESALAAARQQARPDDLICIAGSVFLAGELRPYLVAGDFKQTR
jgi:dihydrofolate synthase/folylpolyglutamate synthase